MSEEATHNLPAESSFEERVFARFDGVDQRLDGFDMSVQRLEAEWERRDAEEKLMWERLLAGILKVQQKLSEVKMVLQDASRKIDVSRAAR